MTVQDPISQPSGLRWVKSSLRYANGTANASGG
jgi:hypothetical protein